MMSSPLWKIQTIAANFTATWHGGTAAWPLEIAEQWPLYGG
jgi:hypothetical protein